MPLIFNDGYVVNYDLINTRVARLDSDDGPMMIVDMNYPEFKSGTLLHQGPWRDSAGGEGDGQLKWSDAYPSDGFDSYGNENDMYKEMLALAARRKVEDAFHDAQMESERQAGRKRARMLEQYQDDLQAELEAAKRKASLEAFRAQQARDDIFSLLQTHGK